ncbi:helix-turn-helix domain-containing protein [Nocardia sp. IFM 10818]
MTEAPTPEEHHIEVDLERLRQRRGITMAELSRRVGISEANLYALRRGDKRGIRFPALSKLCAVLECTPGELLLYRPPSTHITTVDEVPATAVTR